MYESRHRASPSQSPTLYQAVAGCLKRDIDLKQEIPLLRKLAETHQPIESMLADVVWNSRITRNREMHCPELHALIGRLTEKSAQ
jgi:hypothetical protein